MKTTSVQAHHLIGREAIAVERQALQDLETRLDAHFDQACELLLQTKGRVIVMGIGKSGHIARKIASTLASTGTPAFYVHPTEASHGDLGMLSADDSIIAISNSGNTAELVVLLPLIKQIGTHIIAITGNAQSRLGEHADVILDIAVQREACPLGLAPTASTTATLAMGDAIAVALLSARQFSSVDFATRHPGGHLGKKLLVTAADVMHRDKRLPCVEPDALIAQAVLEMNDKRLGVTAVTEAGRLLGLFTDGDLRRCINDRVDLFESAVKQVMTTSPTHFSASALAGDILAEMQTLKVTHMPIVDNDQLIGIVHIHDLLTDSR